MNRMPSKEHAKIIEDDAYLRAWIVTYRLSTQEAVLLDAITSTDFVKISDLYERLYGDAERSSSAITSQINHVRKKLAKDGVQIHNIRGVGYMIMKADKEKLNAVAKEAA